MTNPVGRPSKSIGGITLAKTRMFQRCFSEEDIQAIANRMKDIMVAPETSPGDFVKAFVAWSRYVIVSADVEAAVKAEVERQLTPERRDELIAFVKAGGKVDGV